VVYLDEADVKMILLRSSFTAVPLEQASVPKAKQFAFYDDVHCTGLDIQHMSNAQAVLTLGKVGGQAEGEEGRGARLRAAQSLVICCAAAAHSRLAARALSASSSIVPGHDLPRLCARCLPHAWHRQGPNDPRIRHS
jgi:hypothetical protein